MKPQQVTKDLAVGTRAKAGRWTRIGGGIKCTRDCIPQIDTGTWTDVFRRSFEVSKPLVMFEDQRERKFE